VGREGKTRETRLAISWLAAVHRVRPSLQLHQLRPSLYKQPENCSQHNFLICLPVPNQQPRPLDWPPVLRAERTPLCDHSLAAQAASISHTLKQACIIPRKETGQAGLDASQWQVPQSSLPVVENIGAGRPAPHPRTSSVIIRSLESSNSQPF
jgi:hypothetical protein